MIQLKTGLARGVAIFIIATSSAFSVALSSKRLAPISPDTNPSPTSKPIAGQSRTPLPDGRILLIGGSRSGVATKTAFLLNPKAGSQIEVRGSLHHGRAFHSSTLLPNGIVLVFGGIGNQTSVVSEAETFNPRTQIFSSFPLIGLSARSKHSATLLTNGDLLIAGGTDGKDRTLGSIEVWSFRSGKVSTFPVQLQIARSGHTATLLPDGSVLLWGGQDENGIALNNGEIVDPNGQSVRLVGRRTDGFTEPQGPSLEGSIPQNGETAIPPDTLIALRFSKPMAMTSLNSATITLKAWEGAISTEVVPTEGGMLAFISPKTPLDSETTYTLTIVGAKDSAGNVLPDSNIVFGTGDTLLGGTFATVGGSEGGGGNDPDRGNGPISNFRQLPMLKGREGITALAGQALTLDGSPLPNVRIEIGFQSAMTDKTGRFLVENVGSGHHVMIVDGSSANTRSASYGLFRVGVDLKAGRTNSLHYTIWMTALDTTHEISISSPTRSALVITNPDVPGLEVHIPAGTVIRDVHGHAVTRLGITSIPVNQPPFPLKAGVRYPIYFTVQPGGATFETHERAWSKSVTNRGKGVTVHYQNYMGAKPNSRFAFWSYDPEQKGWYIYGHGRVSKDAKEIAPEEGTQLWTFDGAMVSSNDNAPKPAPKLCDHSAPAGCNPKPADPVDLQTGLFVYTKTDLTVNDVIPLVLARAYRPGDSISRAFGIGTSMAFDDFMVGDNNDSSEGYTYQDLIAEDGSSVHFTRTSPCAGPEGYCDYTNAIYEATSAPGRFYGAILQYFPSGPDSTASPTSDYWQLTQRSGDTYVFADSDASLNPRDAATQLVRDRYGNKVTFFRDQSSNLTRVVSPNGRWIQFTYDSQNRVTRAEDNAGRKVLYSYNAAGYLETVTDANGGVTTYTYDSDGNMTDIKDPLGITYIHNDYDANGMITKQTMVDGAIYRFSYELDDYSNVTQATVTDPLGNVREVAFNADGFMSSDTRAKDKPEQQTVTYARQSGTGFLLSSTDALNRTTSYSYDADGNMASVTYLAGNPDAATTSFGYDQRYGQVSSIIDPLGNSTWFEYDSYGNMLSATNPLGNSTTFSYSSAGQPVTVTDPLGNTARFDHDSGVLNSITDALGRETSRFIDSAGRVVSVTDPLNEETRFEYDALNEVTFSTDPMGNKTTFEHDANGNLKSVTDANQHQTKYDYDNMDRLSKRTDPLGHYETFTYDLNGNLKTATDRKGQLTTYSYDALNRMKQVQFNDGSTITNTFDAGNRPITILDSQSGTISRAYDGMDRLTSETTPQGTVIYTYDAEGRRKTMTVSGQSQITYGYDDASRLSSIAQGGSNVSFTYDANGRRATLTLPNGVTASYTYDEASQLTGIVYQGGSLAPANLEYTYDLAGRRTSVSGTLASMQLPSAVSSALYNENNQLTQWGATPVSYDLNGNTLSDGMNTYVWDVRNRLASANGNSVTFEYDALSRRTRKDILGANTNYLFDGITPTQELNGSNVTANMITGGVDEYFTRTDAGGVSNFLTDALGSTVALTDAGGSQQVQYSYGPYGAIDISGTTQNTYTYTGREVDGIGLYYYRARYYSPATGRFLSEDPVRTDGGNVNFYRFAMDNPLMYRDPTGLLNVIIWPSAPWGGNIGHVAIQLDDGKTYISYWPNDGSAMTHSLEGDQHVEGTTPTVIHVDGLDESAIAKWWSNFKGNHEWNPMTQNCATTAAQALDAGGAREKLLFRLLPLLDRNAVWTPNDVGIYAIDLGGKVISR